MTPIFTASSNPSPTKSAADWPHASGPTFPELQPTNPLPNTPAVTSDMLQQPANAPIEASNGQPAQPTIAMTPPVANQGPPETTATGSPTTPSAQTAGGNQFPLLLSWVLLTGSGAGNIYHFWSYFDLRNKYRGLAYSTGRKELARYTEYDDRD
jgi:hypothetical protein